MKRATLALAYFVVIVLIIFMADRSDYQFMFDWIHSIPGLDKLGHFFLIGGLSFVVNYSLCCREIRIGRKSFLFGSVIVLMLTFLEECSQIFIRYRTFDLLDLTFDFLGICLFGKVVRQVVKHETALK